MPTIARDLGESGYSSVGVIGLGATGLSLALAFAQAGLRTVGLDVDEARVSALREVHSDNGAGSAVELTSDSRRLRGLDAYVLCVPMRVYTDGWADLRHVKSATDIVGAVLGSGAVVVLGSIVPPGTTAALATTLAKRSGLVVGHDFHLAVAPERIDPASVGGGAGTIGDAPTIVGGMTDACTARAAELMGLVAPAVVRVSRPEAAELAKLFENTSRLVNIALTYELADLCRHLALSPREVIDAAGAEPDGFLPHYPGPGVGGERIPVDPLVLTVTAARFGRSMRLVETAYGQVLARPTQVVDTLADVLRQADSALEGSRVLVVGVAYEPGVADTRNAPALDIIRRLRQRSAKPSYVDPLVAELVVDGQPVERAEWVPDDVAAHDCVVLVTPHEQFLSRPLWHCAPIVLDTSHLLPADDRVHHL